MDISHASPLEERLQQVRAEYNDKPSLALTPSQAQRLFGLDPVAWVTVLESLLAEHFLRRTSEGLFVRSVITHEPPLAEGHITAVLSTPPRPAGDPSTRNGL